MTATEQSPQPLSFEDSLQQLQDVVTELESGNLPLEATITRFRAGVDLARQCQQYIDNAELRVSELAAGQDHLPEMTEV